VRGGQTVEAPSLEVVKNRPARWARLAETATAMMAAVIHLPPAGLRDGT